MRTIEISKIDAIIDKSIIITINEEIIPSIFLNDMLITEIDEYSEIVEIGIQTDIVAINPKTKSIRQEIINTLQYREIKL